MLLDVVIDPVALRGDRWFLGRVYAYPGRGLYFGVTAANFLGWFAVGAASQWLFQRLLGLRWLRGPWRPLGPGFAWAALGVYVGVLGFMLAVSATLGEPALLAAGALVSAGTVAALVAALRYFPATSATTWRWRVSTWGRKAARRPMAGRKAQAR